MARSFAVVGWTETTCSVCSKPAVGFECVGGGVHFRHREGASSKWHWAAGGASVLYFAGDAPHAGSTLHLVEGETDAHALHAAGIAAVGVLGSSRAAEALAQLDETGLLGDYREVVVWREPGAGGAKFVEGARLGCGAAGAALRIASWPLDEPDARALMARIAGEHRVRLSEDGYDGALSHLRLCAAIEAGAERVSVIGAAMRERVEDLARDAVHAGAGAVEVLDVATAARVAELEIPAGWRLSDRLGVEFESGDNGYARVIPVPLVIDCVEVDASDATERLALRWKHRGSDHFLSMPREDAASAKAIVKHARTGLPVTSENARGVVRWLHALEHQQGSGMPRAFVARRSGWAMGRHIHRASEMSLDEGTGASRLLGGLEVAGDADEAEVFARRVVEMHPMAACMLAASLAAPLLHPLRLRGFALHLWGDSRGGKTAALKLAMSAWGDPIRLMGSWSATSNAIEAHAATLCDLPCALDELQAAKSVEHVAQTIYALANGVGRARATMTGDLGAQRSWRTVVLTTGEMPLLPDDAHDGARTRTIDIHAAPFAGDTAATDAAAAHDLSERAYGHLGPAFLSGALLSVANRGLLRDEHEQACAALADRVKGDVPPIKLRSAGAMAMALHWLIGHVGAHEARPAVDIVAAMMSVAAGQAADDDAYGSMTWKAAQAVVQLVVERRADFEQGARVRLGGLDLPEPGEITSERVAWLTVPAMKLACEQAGVPYRRGRELLASAGVMPDAQAEVRRGVLDVPARLFRVSLDRCEEVPR